VQFPCGNQYRFSYHRTKLLVGLGGTITLLGEIHEVEVVAVSALEGTVHTDQGSQYTRHDWQHFLKSHGLQASLSGRGNCHDNAVAESFFQFLKRERIKRHIYSTRNDARGDIVDYIEMFYNNKRRHSFNDLLSPVGYENKFTEWLVSV
jgi:putative transposase